MADVHSKATRSYNMSRIRSKDTKPEMLVRRFLHKNGFRYRLHVKDLPGKPYLYAMADIPYYVMTDQPSTCPICGSRADILSDFYHTLSLFIICECLDSECQHVFFEVEK